MATTNEPDPRRRETRDELLTWAQPFPAYPALVIDGLSDDEEDDFLATVAEA